MNSIAQWDRWLADEDSPNALAPETYDDDAALARVRALRDRMVRRLSRYQVQAASPELYQDGTGLTHFRVTSPTDLRPIGGTLAWVLLSHFGDLATVKDCNDPALLAEVCRVLQEMGYKYIDYEYLVAKTYNGKCPALTGLSWANRYFSLVPEYKPTESGERS